MFMDALGLVSDAQALTATAVSTNTIDLGSQSVTPDIGTGEEVGFGVSIDVALAGTTPTLTLEVIQSASAALSSPTVLASQLLAAAQVTIGKLNFIAIPMGAITQRYIGLRYTLAGTTPTVTVTSWLTSRSLFSIHARNYAKGYSI
jgi:hypothetical protein